MVGQHQRLETAVHWQLFIHPNDRLREYMMDDDGAVKEMISIMMYSVPQCSVCWGLHCRPPSNSYTCCTTKWRPRFITDH